MKQLVVSLLILINLNCFSQKGSSVSFNGAYIVYPVDTLGVVLLNRNMVQLSSGDLALEYLGLNNKLEQTWKNMYPFSEGMSPVFQQVSTNGIILLFADKSGQQYELIKANAEYGDYERFQYEFSDRVQVSEVEVYYDNVWVTGLIGPIPVLFKLNADNSFETIPTGVPGQVKYIGQTKFNRETKGLDFLILADIRKKDALIWRSMNLQGNILQNEMLATFDKKKVRAVKVAYTGSKAHIAGTFSVGSKEKVEGLFWGNISKEKSDLQFNSFKTLDAIATYKTVDEVDEKGFNLAKQKKFKVANLSVFIDGIDLNEEGELLLALEVFKPEYRSRGALERQFIARDRTAQIDQNVYGRRGVFEASGGPDLEGRINRASATDQLQMRFMDQSLAKAVNQGVSYNHTGYMRIDTNLGLMEAYGLTFSLKDFGNLTKSNNYDNHKLRYPLDNTFQQFDLLTKEVISLNAAEDASLINWTESMLLEVSFSKDSNKLTLSSREIN